MKTVTIMQAQHNLSKVLRSIGPNEKLALTRNKKVVAELCLPAEQSPPVFPDFSARAADTWGTGWEGTSSQDLLDEARGER